MPRDVFLNLSAREARLAARGELREIVRVMKVQPPEGWTPERAAAGGGCKWFPRNPTSPREPGWPEGELAFVFPPAAPGDRLLLREAWQAFKGGDGRSGVTYRSTCTDNTFDYFGEDSTIEHIRILRWRPARTLPEWAIRHRPVCTSVRVARLSDVASEADWREDRRRWEPWAWVWVVGFNTREGGQ